MSGRLKIGEDRIIGSYVNLAKSFWKMVVKTSSCWLFLGYVNKDNGGYGAFCWRGRSTGAHRVSWELTHGPIPDGLQVLHRCDVPRCVNPSHLFLGTQADNLKDASAKNRLNVPRPNRRKVTDEQVAEMFALRSRGWTMADIGTQFGVSKTFVSLTLRGKRRVYTAPQYQKASGL